jgi:hypothetical protein
LTPSSIVEGPAAGPGPAAISASIPGENVDDGLLRPNGRLLVVEIEGAGELYGVRIGLHRLGRLGLGEAAPVGLVRFVHPGCDAAGLGACAVIGNLDLGRQPDD